MKRPGTFRKNGGGPRKPQNRQGNPSGKNQNSSSTPRTNSAPRKGGIHPWVSSSASSSQALTSHISIASKNNKPGGTNSRKPQNSKNPYRQKRNNGSNGQGGEKPQHQERSNRGNGRAPQPSRKAVETPVQNSSVTEKPLTGNLNPFDLFCAYHLGIGPKKDYKPANLNEVARRFGQDPATVRQALKECDMDSASLLDRDFDMALAQLDIQVAPEGIDRMELAKSIYEDFLDAPHVKRDWKKILDEDRKENRKVFGG